jgi:AGZA family xanthine/uracil permease-like MFS transporter
VTGMDKEALIAVTCIMSGVATLAVGLFANAPIAMAPGLGLNSIFAYLVVSEKMDWPTALGVVFIAGCFFLILTGLGLRRRIVEAIPTSLISAIGVGIGLSEREHRPDGFERRELAKEIPNAMRKT